MTARHLGYNKKRISIVLILVTALLISGIAIYTEMFRAGMGQNVLSKKVTSVEPSAETTEASAQETSEVFEPITKPVIARNYTPPHVSKISKYCGTNPFDYVIVNGSFSNGMRKILDTHGFSHYDIL